MSDEFNSTYSKYYADFGFNEPVRVIRGKNARVELDNGKQYIDCGMALGSVGLGYAYDEVDNRVWAVARQGVSFSLPSIHERSVAETLLRLMPGYSAVRFAKSSSILATTIVRLCRYATGRRMVAFPGDGAYLGNTDWFLGAGSHNGGIPPEVSNLSVCFHDGSEASLKALFDEYRGDIACVYLEPYRRTPHPNSFYRTLSQLCADNGAVLVFDETLSGFRFSYPCIAKEIGLRPDISIIGKAIANGYPLSAALLNERLAGYAARLPKRDGDLFAFSNTHAGETMGLAACAATMAVYEERPVLQRIHAIGRDSAVEMQRALDWCGIEALRIGGNPGYIVLQSVDVKSGDASFLRRQICRAMTEAGVLFRGVFAPSFSHTDGDMNAIVETFRSVLKTAACRQPSSRESYDS